MAPSNVWKQSYRVRAYETDPSGRASIASLCNYLQEAAANHARDLGVSVEQLQERNSTWVLSRLRVRVESYPTWREEILVETWPSGIERLFATRDFIVTGRDGTIVARAVSWWLMIDVESRRPQRPSEFIASLELADRPRALIESASILSEQDADAPFPDADAPLRDSDAPSLEIRVRYGDLDVNGHANNVRYIEWALEAVPHDVLQSLHVVELDVVFKAEAVFGDPVQVSAESVRGDDVVFAHAIRSSADGRYLAGLITTWRRL